MTRKLIHRAAMTGAALALGLTGTLASGASAMAAPSGDSTVSRETLGQGRYIDRYDNYQQCQGGGEYFLRHGESAYHCYKVSAGYELWVWA
ncbi:hypothetical protein [Streptomyces huiliensis]|uniref:hypothetical protein n=1 Tax=Streptomyces huiliensis TaxID=2876027 RepID=UPI001CBC63D6|nr:hypothetical protein [Streptomyces huiliensis]MBZ4320788.1 hypothetical protein [Streptomyces huiliensis]